MKRTTRSQTDDRQNVLFAFAAVVVVALFAATYALGTSRQLKIGRTKSSDLTLHGDAIRKQLKACTKEDRNATFLQGLKGESADLYKQTQRLEKENDRLVFENDRMQKAHVECAERADFQQTSWVAEDKLYGKKLDAVDKRSKQLREQARRLQGTQGMRAILLLANIKKLGQENARLRRLNEMPSRDVTSSYISALVDKWSETPEFKNQKGEVLPPNRTEMWGDLAQKRKKAILDRYDPDRHAGKIFLPRKLEDGTYTLPQWNGRFGTQDVRHGTFLSSKLCPVTSINRQLRVLYEYALCAVGNNISQFMYPTAFKRCKECHTEYLHNYIETPLVLFCDDCRPMHSTNEFKLLCQGFSSEDQYGNELFWRTRSRLRFKTRFVDLAEEWMRENGVDGNTLAVRLPVVEQERLCKKLQSSKRTILSYDRLLKGKVKEYSSDFDSQCSPVLDEAIKAINARVKDIGDVRVYISTDLPDEDWLDLRSRITANQVYRRLPTGRPTEDDIVDTFIAASCQHLILNRFDIKSAHINEARMLMNVGEELRVRNTGVW